MEVEVRPSLGERLIADFEAQAAGLRVAQMMRLSRGAASKLIPHKAEMLFSSECAFVSDRPSGFVRKLSKR